MTRVTWADRNDVVLVNDVNEGLFIESLLFRDASSLSWKLPTLQAKDVRMLCVSSLFPFNLEDKHRSVIRVRFMLFRFLLVLLSWLLERHGDQTLLSPTAFWPNWFESRCHRGYIFLSGVLNKLQGFRHGQTWRDAEYE